MTDLPRTEHGEIDTSAAFGEAWMVHIQYNTDHDGREIDPEHEEWPETYHGIFETQQEAADWCNAYPDGDTDIHDMYVKCMNRVRPDGPPLPTKETVAYTDGEAAARADLGLGVRA